MSASFTADDELLLEARLRAAAVRRVLLALGDGRIRPTPATLRSLATLAGRVALDLAVLDRNRSLTRQRQSPPRGARFTRPEYRAAG